jgi:hypothetical protein
MSTLGDQVVVIVRIPVPRFAPKWLVRRKMKATIDLYSSIPGLEFKLFTVERDSGDFGGIYTWRDRGSATEWFNPEWFARVKRDRGSEAHVRFLEAPMSIDNVRGGTPVSVGGRHVATLVQIPIPSGVSDDLVRDGFAGAEETYRNVRGLLRKNFVIGRRRHVRRGVSVGLVGERRGMAGRSVAPTGYRHLRKSSNCRVVRGSDCPPVKEVTREDPFGAVEQADCGVPRSVSALN